jgi:8-oxo-(d)GTP phosphatase
VETSSPVLAAGAVVWRHADGAEGGPPGPEVLLVHRPKYDDWSFPKGKVDPGEHVARTAVREVEEETGLTVRLGLPLPQQEYAHTRDGWKRVHYWSARPAHGSAVDRYEPNHEVDEVTWQRLDKARELLTYTRDRDLLDAFAVADHRTEPLVVLRHAAALPRGSWHGPDQERGLSEEGHVQSRQLVPLLRAYGVRRVLSSDAVRCSDTVGPYADAEGLGVEVDHALSEQGRDAATIARRVAKVLGDGQPVVLSTHRPTLPFVFAALGVADPALPAGGFVVLHRSGGAIRGSELYLP